MNNKTKIVDKQVGRNSDLFAQSIGEMDSKEVRYPYVRILVSIIEQAHPEWNQAPNKDRQVANLVFRMSLGQLDTDEVAEIVRLRDAERGYGPSQSESGADGGSGRDDKSGKDDKSGRDDTSGKDEKSAEDDGAGKDDKSATDAKSSMPPKPGKRAKPRKAAKPSDDEAPATDEAPDSDA